ncbi:MAG: carboxypeptidase regulatory-like domain-containing protein [Bacteroidetes bacterium]|nr:carboxypeptidase regulatory-like domain-containing protein [Bacteroidota bacterium]
MKYRLLLICLLSIFVFPFSNNLVLGQGVTTSSISGIVQDAEGNALPGANVLAVHVPSGTQYGAAARNNGQFNVRNMRVGGPYTISASFVGFKKESQENINLSLGQDLRLDFKLEVQAVEGEEVIVTAQVDDIFNANRTGAETFINPRSVVMLPTIKRSTRDLTRLDPRSDGNFSFGGKNWLYNNISLDGSYFNNSFGLDDPAPGGQTNAEPIPYDAVEQVQVSVVPFDVREGGFTGAGINTVTKSGTNRYTASLYSFMRSEALVGNKVSGEQIIANPDLFYNQSGFSSSGALIQNKLFFFVNGEIERREDPGTNFAASRSGSTGLGISRVDAAVMDQIRKRMKDVYGYETGPYENFVHKTENEKVLVKLDWNINEFNNLSFRYSRLDARRDLPPHPFVLSSGGRGPNATSLPFQNAGYKINNKLNSFALELNSHGDNFANRFFASFNSFRDNRDPFSVPFPTIQINEGGVNYTTLGHEPFSIHNILDQDVLQITNNFSYFLGSHVITVGANYESFKFFNSFNIFRHGLFMLDASWAGFLGGTTFSSLADFFARTDPTNPNFYDFKKVIGTGPYKGEKIDVGQLSFYVQDEYLVSQSFNLIFGLRVDMPMYITEPVDNPYSRSLKLLDEDDVAETIDQSKLPDVQPLFSPRVGFNWDVFEDNSLQVRGGTGIFTGRLPFVWIGNVVSNPGTNPNLYPGPAGQQIKTSDDAILQQSFDLNGMVSDFKWPQIWTTNLAFDHKLPWDLLGTLEFIYGKDINGIYVRNADLRKPARYLKDGRPFYTDTAGNNQLNVGPFGPDGGAYVIDNSSEGYNFSITAQLRKNFDFGLSSFLSYTYLEARSLLKSTEIASVLWSENPVQGDPNKPVLSYSEFGNRHRFVAGGLYRYEWSENFATSFGLFFELAEGNRFEGAGGNRYSFTYAGDVNGDGSTVNDLIYIPKNSSEIIFESYTSGGKTVSAADQWAAFNAFIEQDEYLKANRGKIAERFGAVNPWFSNIDLRILQDFAFMLGSHKHTFQLSLDVLNVANLISSDWGVRKVANSAATSPLELKKFNSSGEPVFNFNTAVKSTYIDDPSIKSRWQLQVGLRYIF